MARSKICSEEQCEKPHYAKGLCYRHYYKQLRARFPPCAAEGCEQRSDRRGLCPIHYQRLRRHGNLDGVRTPSRSTARFIDAVSATASEDCILWPFSRHKDGYGKARHGGKNGCAHRIVCELVHGAPPSETHQAAHQCGNSACVNPRHLRWATPLENGQDKVAHRTMKRARRSP